MRILIAAVFAVLAVFLSAAASAQEQPPVVVNVNTGSGAGELAEAGMDRVLQCMSIPGCDPDKMAQYAERLVWAGQGIQVRERKWYDIFQNPIVATAAVMGVGGLTGSAAMVGIGATDAMIGMMGTTVRGDGNTLYQGNQAGAASGGDMIGRNNLNRPDNRITARGRDSSISNPVIDNSPSVEVVDPLVVFPEIIER